MNAVNTGFLFIFSHIYLFIHSHFVSYLLILTLTVALIWVNWKGIGRLQKTKSALGLLFKISLWGMQCVFVAFLLWFLLIHFHTFRILSAHS